MYEWLGIRHEVGLQRKHDYSVGAIYTALGHLERKGLVKSWTTEPLPVRGGRSRRQYEVTAHGRRALPRRETSKTLCREHFHEAGMSSG